MRGSQRATETEGVSAGWAEFRSLFGAGRQAGQASARARPAREHWAAAAARRGWRDGAASLRPSGTEGAPAGGDAESLALIIHAELALGAQQRRQPVEALRTRAPPRIRAGALDVAAETEVRLGRPRDDETFSYRVRRYIRVGRRDPCDRRRLSQTTATPLRGMHRPTPPIQLQARADAIAAPLHARTTALAAPLHARANAQGGSAQGLGSQRALKGAAIGAARTRKVDISDCCFFS